MQDIKVKVCHITSVHQLDDVRIFQKECVSLAKNGFDVILLGFGETENEEITSGVRRIYLKLKKKNRINRVLRGTRQLYKRAIQLDADIYHIHDPELLHIGLFLKKQKKKVIFDSHEFYGEQMMEKHYLPKIVCRILAKSYKFYETYVTQRIDAVIQVCTLEGNNYFHNRSHKNVFIENFPIYKQSSGTTQNYGSKKFVTYIGTLTANRGITEIVKAANETKVKLVLGGNYHSANYRLFLEELPEFSNVNFKGYVNSDNMVEIMDQCFAGLSTLHHVNQYHKIDTLPTKVYDYMAAGIPVILSNTAYAKKINEKYNIGVLVNPKKIKEISLAINYLKQNPEIAKELGRNGRKVFESTFNWTIEEKKLIRLYRTL